MSTASVSNQAPVAAASRQRLHLVCMSPHTGSDSLCAGLSATGLVGNYLDYSHRRNLDEKAAASSGEMSEEGFVDKLRREMKASQTSPGMRLSWDQVSVFEAELRESAQNSSSPLPGLVDAKFGPTRYVWMRRQNRVAQAISWYRESLAQSRECGEDGRPGQFDFHAVDLLVARARGFDVSWERFFRFHRLRPLMLTYEQLAAHYESVVRGVLQFLGLPWTNVPIAVASLPATDRLADQWEREYRARKARERGAPPKDDILGAAKVGPPSQADEAVRPTKKTKAAKEGSPETPRLIAYCVNPVLRMPVIAAPVERAWMDATPRRFAYRCLPMVLANQAGWLILNNHKIAVEWDGGGGTNCLQIEQLGGEGACQATSIFGDGILTFMVPYVFRTPAGINLHVRGPVNLPKDGIAALEGIVETDWSEAPFTMNWKLTRPGHRVVFDVGEPIAMIAPAGRGDIERFSAEIREMREDPELAAGFEAWSWSRNQFNWELQQFGSQAQKDGWQRHYMRGVTVTNKKAPEHQTGLTLAEFVERQEPTREASS